MPVAEGKVDRCDVICSRVSIDPVEGFFEVGEGTRTAVFEDFEDDEVGFGGDCAGDAGDVGTVVIFVAGIGIVVGEVVLIDDLIGDTVIVGICAEVRAVEVGSGVDDDGAVAFAFDVAKANIRPKFVEVDEAGGGGGGVGIAGDDGATGVNQLDVGGGGGDAHTRVGLFPTWLHLFGDGVGAGAEVGEAVVTIDVGGGGGFACV